MKMNIDKRSQGKRNRAAGLRFEQKVRQDLEIRGWFVSKFQGNVEFSEPNQAFPKTPQSDVFAKLVPAKGNRFRARTLGFPDYIAWRKVNDDKEYEIAGVECKGGNENHKYLSKEEKAKCQWLLQNKVFSKILVANKVMDKNRIKVEYRALLCLE